ncbi:uncharacterized protein LOC122265034 [Penaeus japonicus]|uniref:uncharacterized protein LOC122265034 n=1 Tax=Penaeus japonicus TaxID=27405 RepID=UPI001C7171BE|nr:uncharacterized protein LOC122265034 [Penaeus japonicus]
MRHLLLLALTAANLLLFAECFLLPPGYAPPVFPALPLPYIPLLGVIQANGLMPLLVSTLMAMHAGTIIALFGTGGYRRKRSSSDAYSDPVYLIMSAVSRLDTHGCILKLLCQLKAEESSGTLTSQERILVEVFASHLDVFAEKGTGESYALGDDGRVQDEVVCGTPTDQCPFGAPLLRNLLRQVWGTSFL